MYSYMYSYMYKYMYSYMYSDQKFMKNGLFNKAEDESTGFSPGSAKAYLGGVVWVEFQSTSLQISHTHSHIKAKSGVKGYGPIRLKYSGENAGLDVASFPGLPTLLIAASLYAKKSWEAWGRG